METVAAPSRPLVRRSTFQNAGVIKDDQEGEEINEQFRAFWDQWMDYIKIKKFQQQAIMETFQKVSNKPVEQAPAEKRLDLYKLRRMIKDEVFEMNKSNMKQYLFGNIAFAEKQQLLSKLYFGAGNFRDMKILVSKMLGKSDDKNDDGLEEVLKNSKLAEQMKRKARLQMKEFEEKTKKSIQHKQIQEELAIQQLSDKIKNELKEFVVVKRLFTGEHLIEPTSEDVKIANFPVRSVQMSKVSLYMDGETLLTSADTNQTVKTDNQKESSQKKKENFIESVSGHKTLKGAVTDMRKMLRGAEIQIVRGRKLENSAQKLLEAIKNNRVSEFMILVSKMQAEQILDIVDRWGNTPKHYAAKYGKDEMCKLVFGLKLESDSFNFLGQTPIDLAGRFKNQNFIRLYEQKPQRFWLPSINPQLLSRNVK